MFNFKMGVKEGSRAQCLFVLLCLVAFLSAITTGHNVFKNAWLIFWYEALFVGGYFLLFKAGELLSERRLFPQRKTAGFWLLVAWFVSVTLSLLNSPYGLMTEWFAVSRYFQTLFHVVFFLCLLDFLPRYRGSLSPLMLSISISVFVLAFIFIGAWMMLDPSQEMGRYFWFRQPPQNAHIRITGFIITVASVIFAPYFFYKEDSRGKLASLVFVSSVVSGFLFWSGGRGAMLSVWITYFSIFLVLVIKKQPVKKVLLVILVLSIGGVFLAELFKVFSWNGVFQATARSVDAGGDIYKLSTGRPKLWGWVLESLNATGSYAFGLGSQGYCYMPNRTFAFQPHNLIFQFLAEWGIVGSIIFLLMLMSGFVRGFKTHVILATGRISAPAMAAGALVFALGVHSLVDGIFYHAQSSFYMAIAFAVWMVPQKK